MQERLQKIISRAGVASRRHAEQMILSGLVTVNGRVVTELGTKADGSRDHIKVSGKLLKPEAERLYLAFNKPANVVASLSDPEGRRSLADCLRGVKGRVYPVGRLEYASTGLLLLTNDGELANRVMRAHNLRQTYYFKLKGNLSSGEIRDLQTVTGLKLERVKSGDNPWYEVTLTEARRDSLREKLAQIGHPVEKIRRSRIGPIELGALGPGQTRALTEREIAALEKSLSAAGRGEKAGKRPAPQAQISHNDVSQAGRSKSSKPIRRSRNQSNRRRRE